MTVAERIKLIEVLVKYMEIYPGMSSDLHDSIQQVIQSQLKFLK